MNGTEVAPINRTNGLSQGHAINGHGQAAAPSNGTMTSARTESPAATIESSKERARSVVAMSTNSGDKPSTPARKSIGPSDPPQSSLQSANAGQSRKRSRSGSRLPQSPSRTDARHDRDQPLLETYVDREQLNAAAIIDQTREWKSIMAEKNHSFQFLTRERKRPDRETLGLGYAGYGNGLQDVEHPGQARVKPRSRARPNPGENRRVPGELRISRKDQATQAEQIDELVPIRLDIESEKLRLRDTFTWNIHDRVIDHKLFARKLVEDLNLDLTEKDQLIRQIESSMEEQIADFHPHVYFGEDALDPHLPYFAYKNDEMRIVIKLNIIVGQLTLVDQFEWDINNPLNSPEEFAQKMATDLSLSGEFTTAIAHSIREQCQLFTRSLYVTGHPFDGRPIEDHELLASFQPSPLPSIFRPHQAAKDFTPWLYEMNEQELEKNETSLSREERRQKRSVNRRGGPMLPDLKDRRRTIRTLLVSSVLPGAVQSIDNTRLYKKVVASNKGKREVSRLDGLDDSDVSESDDSSVDSPAVSSHLLAGTARTRGLRGAATASAAATRNALGRSATPDSTMLHHHETRTSGRRIVHDESSPEASVRKIVKLRLPRQKFRNLLQSLSVKNRDTSRTTPVRPTSRQSSIAPAATPGSMGPPTTTPRIQAQSLPQSNATPNSHTPSAPKGGASSSLGRVDATGPPGPEHPPPRPPAPLRQAVEQLQAKYPNDAFEVIMRYTAIDLDTDEQISLKGDGPHPQNIKYCYCPRIKCRDCPGKLYTPDQDLGVTNFEVHLRNRVHREKVNKRTQELGKD